MRRRGNNAERKILIRVKNVYTLFSLTFRDHTAQIYKDEREAVKQSGLCPICKEPLGKRRVEAIHKHGNSREEIVRQIVGDKNEVEFDYVVLEYRRIHREYAIVAIGCKKCHNQYGTDVISSARNIPDEFFIKAKR